MIHESSLTIYRSNSLRHLNWRKRKGLYVQLELLNNTFGDEISTALPIIIAYATCSIVATLVLAVELTAMRVSLLIAVSAATLALSYTVGGFFLMRAAESLETESLGLMNDLRSEIAKESRSIRLARVLTRRRLIRYNVGSFMVLGNGTALSLLMTILDNTVSGIVMVVPAPKFYLLEL